MPDTLCRLTVHVAGSEAATADLTVPADAPVGTLVPSIVDVAVPESMSASESSRWRLVRPDGSLIETSMTLRDNEVRDGDALMLTTVPPPPPQRRPGDPCAVVAETSEPAACALRVARLVAALAATVFGAALLVGFGGPHGSTAPAWTAAGLAVTGAAVAVTGRMDQWCAMPLHMCGVLFAASAGYLSAREISWQAAVMLAASAAFTTSILLLRMASGTQVTMTAMTAVTALAGLVGAVAAVGVAFMLPAAVLGAALTVLSLGALSAAPRLAVLAAGLRPSQQDVERCAIDARRKLTGLVLGWSSSATLGVAGLAVAGASSESAVLACVFAADVGLVLLLRQRSHADAWCRIALGGAGFGALMAAEFVAVDAVPHHAHLICATGVILGATTLFAWPGPANPVVRHGVRVVEYVALTAVIPLAAWLAGVYGFVRDLSLL